MKPSAPYNEGMAKTAGTTIAKIVVFLIAIAGAFAFGGYIIAQLDPETREYVLGALGIIGGIIGVLGVFAIMTLPLWEDFF